MVGKIYKKVLVLIILILIVEGIGLIGNNVYALSDVTEWIDGGWTPSVGDDPTLKQTTRTILGVISAVGTIISVAALGVIGVKYMVGSVEEKASYKQTLLPWLLGSAMIFSVTIIPNIIYNLTDAVMYKDVVIDKEYYESEARKEVEKNTSKRSQYLAGRYDKLQEIKGAFLNERKEVLKDLEIYTGVDYERLQQNTRDYWIMLFVDTTRAEASNYFNEYMENGNYYSFGQYEVCDEISKDVAEIILPDKTIQDIISEMSIYFEMPMQDEENNKKDRKQGRVDAIQKIKEDLLRDKEAYKEEIKGALEEDYEVVDQIHKSNLAYYYVDMLANSANMYYDEYISTGSYYKLGWYDVYSEVPDVAGDIMYSDKTVEEMISEMNSYLEQMLMNIDKDPEEIERAKGRADEIKQTKEKLLKDKEKIFKDLENATNEDYESVILASKIMLSEYYWSELQYNAEQYFQQYLDTDNYYARGRYEVCDEVSKKAREVIVPEKSIEDIISEMLGYLEDLS